MADICRDDLEEAGKSYVCHMGIEGVGGGTGISYRGPTCQSVHRPSIRDLGRVEVWLELGVKAVRPGGSPSSPS
jgi:hypothetical protein